MTETNLSLAWDDLAWFYNRYWGGRFVDKVLPTVEKVVLDRLPEGAAILDLCCGTGQLARHLTERGYRVYGVDSAAGMLEYASINAPQAQFIHSHAQCFTVPEPVNAVLSTFDSLNHIGTIGEMTTVFRAVHRALLADGLFLFDLNMEEAFLRKWKGSFKIEKPDHRLAAKFDYSTRSRTGKFTAKMARLENGRWRCSETVFMEHCFEQDDVMEALVTAGFAIHESGPATQFGIDDSGRLMVLAQRTPLPVLS